ncbi:MAG: hypothetical protein VX265_06580, partial [Myxococcota bacterium]|nr:hypothetical protein [Myxococcota bacterium]
MTDLVLLCTLPAERASLAAVVVAAGGTPVIDLTASARVAVPADAWVRVRSRRSVPGTGPVVLVAGADASSPVRNRETWLEVTVPQAAPEGFAGIVLRGVEAGGPCGAAPGLELLASVPQGTRVMLDSGVDPAEAAAAAGLGAEGVVLSDVLLGLDALGLPPRLSSRLQSLEPASLHVVNGYRLVASPLSPVLRRLLGGASFWELAQGWLEADDPAGRVWPGGTALTRARALAAAHADIPGLLAAYRQEAPVPAGVARPPAPARVATAADGHRDDAVAIIGLG